MKKTLVSALVSCLISTSALAADKFTTVNDSAPLGVGNIVTLESSPLRLTGQAVKIGEKMPSVLLKKNDLSDFDTTITAKNVRIYSVIASVDTPVCDEQLHELSDYLNANSIAGIEFLAVSADTPFAQARFAKTAKISDKVTFLSDSVSHSFGNQTGTQIDGIGLLTRTIIVVDKTNTIRHIQRVPELTTTPDLAKAVKVAQQYI
ncbi:hypothetical protein A3K86_16530 [Photobacterium jeanii]|uniref:Thioredoxin domain-containing protein n=1 Tax=Photobacterium jeanii TaxID=858640 RepID=A0A178K9A5_9GAMM|nr:redoxin family protein [Photobacterium jeanii]OAN13262.1 hypothetical protein A3K86_16530 [Photobacterium jeanii]PST90259.1 thioredoxin peroxidase [Photobacterium jeanii]